eukprot:CAMPEP_0205806976 /NCGR_PEP_ID=MMETSP0205-20121125/10632_1 /ASSEMBLY_ACC=CAM_ASM_000278 /TAXON_ID=36767 /ORGANISM="Euplotes focardii, Strain TN1" /LENGTH=152 /DNA_ID=CAMNT_0053080597 /DNA_START=420 /DNA_END=875 /DNA_ORIENTATION=-
MDGSSKYISGSPSQFKDEQMMKNKNSFNKDNTLTKLLINDSKEERREGVHLDDNDIRDISSVDLELNLFNQSSSEEQISLLDNERSEWEDNKNNLPDDMNSFMLSEISIDGDFLKISASAKQSKRNSPKVKEKIIIPQFSQDIMKKNSSIKI